MSFVSFRYTGDNAAAEHARINAGELSSQEQHFSRGFKGETFSGSIVKGAHDSGNLLRRDLVEIGTFGKELPD